MSRQPRAGAAADIRVTIRLTESEAATARDLAAEAGEDMSSMLRRLIRAARVSSDGESWRAFRDRLVGRLDCSTITLWTCSGGAAVAHRAERVTSDGITYRMTIGSWPIEVSLLDLAWSGDLLCAAVVDRYLAHVRVFLDRPTSEQIAAESRRRADEQRRSSAPPQPSQQTFPLLGLVWPFDSSDAKRAFKAACLKHHPDQGGSPETFRAVVEEHRRALHMIEMSEPEAAE